jgi:hypothetical protein
MMRDPQNDARKNPLIRAKAFPQLRRANMSRLMDGLVAAGAAHS